MLKLIPILLISYILSAPISNEQADRVAQNIFVEFSGLDIESYNVDYTDIINENNQDLIFIYHLSPQGFIMISADNQTHPIIGYSFDNNLSIQNLPDNLSFVLNNIKSNIFINSNSISPRSNEISSDWNKYLGTTTPSRERNVSPLIDAEFDQSGSWNNVLQDETGFNGPLGCVAISMGQILHYWEYPATGEGSNAYYDADVGNVEVDFSQAYYDYDSMANTYATPASRLLLYHMGISVNMDYAPGGSGAAVGGVYPSAEYAMKTFFKYDDGLNNIDYDDYELTEYRNILKDQLEHGKPIIYVGFSDEYGNGGHAWNIDGYQNNNMHCNWGWGGWNNGYFNLVTMNGFDTWNSALLDLIPEIYVDPLALYEFEVNDMTATFIDLSEFINESEIAIWSWDFGDGTTQDNTYGFAEHTYSQSGEYTVSLNVTNIYGETGQNHFETITIGSSLSGDVNGDSILNILDVVMLVNFVLGTDSPTGIQFNSADFNGDGVLNILDVVLTVNTILG